MRRIQSKSHKIGTCGVNNDNKRYILDDGVHTLADFHKDFKKQVFAEKKTLSKNLTGKKRFSQILISFHK